jgi:hypothetical protein
MQGTCGRDRPMKIANLQRGSLAPDMYLHKAGGQGAAGPWQRREGGGADQQCPEVFAPGPSRPCTLGAPTHHFRPEQTTSPLLVTSTVACMLVASLDATCGSVMANAERMVPARRGCSHCCCCCGLPYMASTSMLPCHSKRRRNTAKCSAPQ